MTLNRRQFLGSTLPLVALGAEAGARISPALPAAEQMPPAAPPAGTDNFVLLVGDALPRTAVGDAASMQALLQNQAKPVDGYLAGGAVAQLEAKMSALLGKEDSVFMPTGTMANHIAIRLLCGDARHALVQQESHVYRDEADGVTTLSGINMVPLAGSRAAPTLGEVNEAISRAEIGPYPIKVGAIALESPVRRAEGATLPAALIADVARLARAKGIPMHLDGARLLLMCGIEGFDLKKYCEPFDTVYVSLYKYLGAPYGAMLSGPKPLMTRARALRHVFGGTIYHGWQAALPALATLDGAEQRFAAVRKAGDRLLARLDDTAGFKVRRVEHGSNIAFVSISAQRQAGLEERMKHAQVKTGAIVDGWLEVRFNETILRRDTGYLLAAFGGR